MGVGSFRFLALTPLDLGIRLKGHALLPPPATPVFRGGGGFVSRPRTVRKHTRGSRSR